MTRQSSEHSPPCSPAGKQEHTASPPWQQLHGTLLQPLRRARRHIENLSSRQVRIPSVPAQCDFSHTGKCHTSPRLCCKNMFSECFSPFLFSQSPVSGTIARHFYRIYQVVIVDQCALAFHLVSQERCCDVFACTGKGIDPDESAGGSGLGGHDGKLGLEK